MLVLLLLAGNIAFHLEAHFRGAADTGIRIGIAVVVLLISLIGGRIIPSFTPHAHAKATTLDPERSLGPHTSVTAQDAKRCRSLCWRPTRCLTLPSERP